MKKYITFILALTVALAACGGLPNVHNVPTRKITLHNTSMRDAILQAGANKGWRMHEIKDGLIEASLSRRGHDVWVHIPYTQDSYAITYKDSNNMYYNAKKGTIHRKYNQWVLNLDLAITRAAMSHAQ